jgi:hypothetical protein
MIRACESSIYRRYLNAMECVRQRRLLAKATTRMQSVQLHFAFDGWLAVTIRCAHARTQAAKLCQQLLARSLAKSFRVWRELTQATKMRSWLEGVTLAQIFHTWQVFVATRRSVKHTAEVLFKRATKMNLCEVRLL